MLQNLTLSLFLVFGSSQLAFGQDAALPALPPLPSSNFERSSPQSSNPLTLPEPAVLPKTPILSTQVQSPLRPIEPAPPSSNEVSPLVPVLPVPGDPLGSSIVSPLPTPLPISPVERPFITPTQAEVILRASLIFASPNITGQRRAPVSFNPVAPWRFPRVEAAGLQASGGLSFEFGYQFTLVPFALVGRFSTIGEEQEVIFRNYDPLYDAYQNDPVVQRLRQASNNNRNSSDTTDEDNVRVLPGQPDIFGSSLVRTRLSVSNLDFVAESPKFNVGWTSYRFWGGVRQTWFFLDENTKGRGIEQVASTSFEGWGPLLGGRVNFGFTEQNDVGIYFQAEGALLTGTTTQIFSETFTYPYPSLFTYARERENRVVPNLNFEIGLYGYSSESGRVFFQIAYQFNQWIDIGKIGSSNVGMYTHGAMVRLGMNY